MIEHHIGSSDLFDESIADQLNRHRLMRQRRRQNNIAWRPVNGPVEWEMLRSACGPNEEQKAQLCQLLHDKLSQIESVEMELIKVENQSESSDNLGEIDRGGRAAGTVGGHYLLHDLRNRRFIHSQFKLKLNRMQEEYRQLYLKWKKFK